MRVTSNLFPGIFNNQLNELQERRLKFQTQIASGVSILKPSDDPVGFHLSQQLSADQAKLKSYLDTGVEVRALQEANYNAMGDIQRILSRMSELGIRGNGALDPQALQALGVEATSLVDQLVTIANRTFQGNYLFGGTGNVAPIDAASGPNYTYNAASTATVTKAKVNDGSPINTGIVAGRSSNDNPPTTVNFSGFLVSSTVNTLVAVKDVRDALSAGTAVTQAQVSALNDAINLTAEFVGRTASALSASDVNEASLRDSIKSGTARIDTHTGVDMAEAALELSRTEFHYQAALQSGSRILNISLLDFI